MRFLAGILLMLFSLSLTQKAQDLKPEGEILSSSEKIVKGVPFSAEARGESIQIMFNGNKITRRVKTLLYRDSEGRFRRDDSQKPVGLGSFVEMPPSITIFDPVARIKSYLDPQDRTARQSVIKDEASVVERQIRKEEESLDKWRREFNKRKQLLEMLAEDVKRLEEKAKNDKTEELRQLIEKRKQELEKKKQQIRAEEEAIKKRRQEIEARRKVYRDNQSFNSLNVSSGFSHSNSSSNNSENGKTAHQAVRSKSVETAATKREALGTKQLKGLIIEGTRFTRKIPAGEIGNEREFEIVYEIWYSNELQIIIFSKYVDPRFGEQTYELTNLKREEPDSTLFKIPADYKIVTEKGK